MGLDLTGIPEAEILAVLPGGLKKIASLVSLHGTLEIVECYGGGTWKVPVIPRGNHQVARLIGIESFTRICREFSGTEIEIPKAASVRRLVRNREIVKARKEGASTMELARRFDLTQRAIFKILKKVT